MVLDPYGRVISETWKAGDDVVVADLDAGLMDRVTGGRWIRTRRPDLYGDITAPSDEIVDTRNSRMGKGL